MSKGSDSLLEGLLEGLKQPVPALRLTDRGPSVPTGLHSASPALVTVTFP